MKQNYVSVVLGSLLALSLAGCSSTSMNNETSMSSGTSATGSTASDTVSMSTVESGNNISEGADAPPAPLLPGVNYSR